MGWVAQQRDVVLHLTVIGAHLHSDDGTLAILDEVRLAIAGFKPPNCLPCDSLQERFLSEDAGAWQYELTVQTQTQQVQVCQPENLPWWAQIESRPTCEPLNPNLKPKKP
ncbi:Gp37 family protein [Kingella kingae]|uniref:Gp37 family protein n=1 Tax=Kingella kingae TaxID=504 RepID=UPI00040AB5D8|nr:Gp37 family protein [Kingella kingae]